MGRLLFPAAKDGLPATAGPVSGQLWCQIVKDLSIVRGRLGDSCSSRDHRSPCGLRANGGNTDWKSWYLAETTPIQSTMSLRQPLSGYATNLCASSCDPICSAMPDRPSSKDAITGSIPSATTFKSRDIHLPSDWDLARLPNKSFVS